MNVKITQIFVAHTQLVIMFLALLTVYAKKDLYQRKVNFTAQVWIKGNLVKDLLGPGILLTRVLRRSCLRELFLFEEKSVTVMMES